MTTNVKTHIRAPGDFFRALICEDAIDIRYSLKWILRVMAYVAFAAAVFGQPGRLGPDNMWSITILATAFGVAIAVCGRGPRRAAASGFVGPAFSAIK